jgi:hypothetical protein
MSLLSLLYRDGLTRIGPKEDDSRGRIFVRCELVPSPLIAFFSAFSTFLPQVGVDVGTRCHPLELLLTMKSEDPLPLQ